MLRQEDISEAGKVVDTIPVSISYRIIELFSGHLYSNPAKAIEELVVNSYDAFARRCEVVLPNDWDSPNARILVWDDGESMDSDGMRELWLIAATTKREAMYSRKARQRHRLPIGKFGIGKLASYVIGNRITHICKRDKLLAVTMDYSEVLPQGTGPPLPVDEPSKQITLGVREISEQEARKLLDFATSGTLPNGVSLPLFGENSPSTWTLVVVDRLKDAAKHIAMGKLRWIISTALPLVPDFQVSLNGEMVPPSRLNYPILKKWVVGKNDKTAEGLGYQSHSNAKKDEPFDSWIEIPRVGKVSGELDLYEDSLLGRKAEEIGRSHGFFLMVRHRLINHDDPLLGIHVLSHATFNRLHAVIYADDLDDELVASRETISEESKVALQEYLVAKFGEIRKWYEDHLSSGTKEEGLTDRLSSVPGQLVRFPIIHAIDRAKHDGKILVRSIELPPKGKPKETIGGFQLSPLDPTSPLAVFDAATGFVKVNTNHPFYINYYDSPNMEAVATAEVLLEAYLLETRLAPNEVREFVDRHDQLLRALVKESPRSVTIIARQLRDSYGAPKEMKEACHRAFRALGFEVVALGGENEPDGLASAPLPAKYGRELGQFERSSYKITYYAHPSKFQMNRSESLELPRLARHRRKYGAQYTAIVAADFSHPESVSSAQDRDREGVCFIQIKDFASLVEAAGMKPLPLSKLETLFRDCQFPDAVHGWVQQFRSSPDTLPELREILDRAFVLQESNRADPPSIGAIKYYRKTLTASEREINEWLTALSRLLPGLIYVYGEKVELHQTPEIIVRQFQQSLQHLGRNSG